MSESKLHSWLDSLLPIAGAGCLGLGLLVLFGWFTRTDAILQIGPQHRAMVPNTAVCFLLGGAAILGLSFGQSTVAGVCGGLIACMAAIVGSQYLFEADLGIDRLLIEPYITVETPSPGRMAPHTVACFLSGGLAFLLLARAGACSWRPLASAALGVVVTALASVALLEYWTNLRVAYAWGPRVPMAAHSAAGCALLGLGILASAWRERRTFESSPRWLPILVGVALTTLTITQWEAARVFADAQLARDGWQERWLTTAILCGGLLGTCAAAFGVHAAQRRHARRHETFAMRAAHETEL